MLKNKARLKNKVSTYLFVMLFMASTTVYSAEIKSVTVSVDRAWGLLLGDEIIVTAELPDTRRSDLDEESLPAISQRQGFWLVLRDIQFKETADNLSMMLHYQVVNTGNKSQQVSTPEFSVRKIDNAWIAVPSVPLMLSAMLPAELAADSAATTLRSDHKAPLFDTVTLRKKTLFWAGLAGLSFLLSMFWHFAWRKQHRQPFEQALIQLRKIKGNDTPALSAAARALHEAFNRTAGETIVQSTVANLLASNTRLNAHAEQIEQFYSASSAFFFNPDAETNLNQENILSLAKSCRNVERLA